MLCGEPGCGAGAVIDIGMGAEASGGGIVIVGGVDTIAGLGTANGDAGVAGASSLASESPSLVSPGGKVGATTGEASGAGSEAVGSECLRPNAAKSTSTAW